MFRWCRCGILLLFCFMIVFCSFKDDICGFQLEKGQAHFMDTIKYIGIKLCELKCTENGQCLSFQYNLKALTCRLSSAESKRIRNEDGYLSVPRSHSSVSSGKCGCKGCLPTFRCLESRNGQAVCVKGWKQSYPGVTPQYMERRTLKSNLYDACMHGDLKRVKWIVSHTRVNINSRYGEKKLTPLLVTAFYGHRQAYDFLVTRGAEVSLLDVDGSNILHVASKGGHEEMVKCVLSQNIVDVNSRDKRGRTPVMWAVYFGHRDVYNLLVLSGANISLVDNTLRNILFLASGPGHVQIVQDILARNIIELNSRADNDMTAIMFSVLCGNKDVYDLLISNGADVLLVNDFDRNILHLACWGGHVEIVKYVLLQNIVNINSRDKDGNTPLMVSSFLRHRDVFDLLVSEGADVFLVNDYDRNVIYSACEGGHVDMVKYILSQNIADINSRDKEGFTPAMWAAFWGHREVYDFLVNKGANVSLVAHSGRNILHSAAEGGFMDMVKCVLSQNIFKINSKDRKGATPLMLAAYGGHRDIFDLLVSEGADVSLVTDDGENVLFSAAAGGHVDMVKYLLSQNIFDINSRNRRGKRPLMEAAYWGHRDIFDLLVSEGADVSLVTDDSENVLFSAAAGGHVDMVKYLLSQNIFDINSRNRRGKRPLMEAAYWGHRDIFDLLVSEGADVSLVTDDGENVLFSAAAGGHVDMVKYLLSQNIFDINSRNRRGKSPLMEAAYWGHKDIFDLLVSEGADVSLVTDDGQNILYSASLGGQVNMVKYILSQNISDINSRDKRGKTPVMLAAGLGRTEVYDFLVNRGADISVVDHNGGNILHCAAQGGRVEIVKSVLLQNIVDINSRDRKGVTPLMVAAYGGHREVFDLLVSEGANVSLVNDNGQNILYSAAAGGHVHMVRYVLSQRIVDINSRDRKGFTPVMGATYWGRREVYDLLVSEGADVSLVTNRGNNVLHIASRKGRTRMVRHILQQHVVDIQTTNKYGLTPAMIAKLKWNMTIFKLLQSQAGGRHIQ